MHELISCTNYFTLASPSPVVITFPKVCLIVATAPQQPTSWVSQSQKWRWKIIECINFLMRSSWLNNVLFPFDSTTLRNNNCWIRHVLVHFPLVLQLARCRCPFPAVTLIQKKDHNGSDKQRYHGQTKPPSSSTPPKVALSHQDGSFGRRQLAQ